MADSKLLASIQRTDTEQLQISISEYRGKSYFNLRIFYTTDDGATWLPTKKGVTFAPDQLDILSEAIEEAKKEFMQEAQPGVKSEFGADEDRFWQVCPTDEPVKSGNA